MKEVQVQNPTVTSQEHELGASKDQHIEQRHADLKQIGVFPIQTKLVVGTSDDPLEAEADAMADKVMRQQEQSFIQRKCASCENEEEEKIQRKPGISHLQRKCAECEEEDKIQTKPANSFLKAIRSGSLSSQLSSTKGSGRPLPRLARSFMESRMVADFSDVQIHNDDDAANMNRQLGAQAFTYGSNIYFNKGKYNPESYKGKHLLAHELTHVIQQGKARSGILSSKMGLQTNIQRTYDQEDERNVQPVFHYGEFSGRDSSSDVELQDQLDEGDVSFWSIYQDNRAREIVRRWLDPNYPRFRRLDTNQRILLVRQMLSGATFNDDERAILELLGQTPEDPPSLRRIVNAVTINKLERDIDGDEYDELQNILQNIRQREGSTVPGSEPATCVLFNTGCQQQDQSSNSTGSFQLNCSRIGRAIFEALGSEEITSTVSCATRNRIIALLAHSPTFLGLAERLQREYFTNQEGLTFNFHSNPETGSHFSRQESRISVMIPSAPGVSIELLRSIVHEVVHASNPESQGRPAEEVANLQRRQAGSLGVLVESRIEEESETRRTENTILAEIIGSDSGRRQLGENVSENELDESESDSRHVRKDFGTGLPRLTYLEQYTIEELLNLYRGNIGTEETNRMTMVARQGIDHGLMPEANGTNSPRFNFAIRTTRRFLSRQIQGPQTCPALITQIPPTPPANRQEAVRCIERYYSDGRPTSLPTSYSSECRAFLAENQGEISTNLHRLYTILHSHRCTNPRLCYSESQQYYNRIDVLQREMQERHDNPNSERERCLEENRRLGLQNQPIQEFINIATIRNSDQRQYFEWIVIREVFSREWQQIPATAGGIRTPADERQIEQLRSHHFALIRQRVGRLLGNYRYDSSPR